MKKVIGLFDVDFKQGFNVNNTQGTFPNLALMKISAHYKAKGYEVKWYSPVMKHTFYKIFASKVFKWKTKMDVFVTANMIKGGSGFDLSVKLPEKIEHRYPDYKLYGIDYAMGFLCYDKETQVLTDKGWKYFRNLSYRDKVLTLNPLNHNIEYQRPTEIISNEYEGDLIHFKNKYTDLLVTPNHRMYVKKRDKDNEFKFLRADYLEKLYQFQFKKNGKWKGKDLDYFYLPKIKKTQGCNLIEKIPMDLWIEFLGYYIAEGSTQYKKKTHNYVVKISQSKKSKYYSKMESCIKKLGLNYYKHPSGDFFLSNKQLYSYLKSLGKSYEKYIPREFLNLSKRQLQILWNSIYAGDGTHFTKVKTQGISTSSHRLASDLQELLLKIGYCGDIRLVREKGSKQYFKKEDRYIVARHNHYIIFKNTHYINPVYSKNYNKTKRIYYKGKVYCCSVPNEILYVRRNGVAVWCGNTRGCSRQCDFCIVNTKEGLIHKHADLEEFWIDQNKIMLLDNNILSYEDHIKELVTLRDTGTKIQFNQGLDIRLIDEKNASVLLEIPRWRGKRYNFAFDHINLQSIIEKKLKLLYDVGFAANDLMFYVLIGFDSTPKEDLKRIEFLKSRDLRAYAMPYDPSDPYQRCMKRWTNFKPFYWKMSWKEYLEHDKDRKEVKDYVKKTSKPISKWF